MKLMDLSTNEYFKCGIERKFNQHHELYSGKIDGTHWEELLYKVLKDVGVDVVYDNGSHRIGTDMEIDGMNVSCKSGNTVHKKRADEYYYNFSGSRTSKYNTLSEKLDFLKSSDVTDYAFCEAYPIKEDGQIIKWVYTLRTMDHSKISYDTINFDYSDMSGEPLPKTIKGVDNNSLFHCTISKSMSGQIWYMVPLDSLSVLHSFEITLND